MTHNLLEEIVAVKKKNLEKAKAKTPLEAMVRSAEKSPKPVSLAAAIDQPDRLCIIAEMKKKSPSAGEIVPDYDPAQIASRYEKGGASAISVLTEEDYFGGRPEHLQKARGACRLPVLRKDFTVDPYQIYEARALGASAVLLIAAVLSRRDLGGLLRTAQDCGLDALVEVHDADELDAALAEDPKLIGINNRNLKDLSIDLETTLRLIGKVPQKTCVVSESGIREPGAIRELKAAGVRAALIGESILKGGDMEKTLRSFVEAGR